MKQVTLYTFIVLQAITQLKAQNVGIGTSTPLTKLTVQTLTGLYGFTHTDGTVTVGSYIGNGAGWLGTQSNHRLAFFTNNSNEQMVLSTAGNLGIGTTSPNSKLVIRTPDNTTGFTHESDGGIVLGESIGGISAGMGTFSNHIFRLFANGTPVIHILPTSQVGIGTAAPGIYKLKLSHGGINSGDGGFDIENAATGDHWSFFNYIDPVNVKQYLSLSFNGDFKGDFVASTGIYSSVSDERRKKNIGPMEPVLAKVMQLKPSTYQFRNTDDQNFYNGFIAQDVKLLFPSLVFNQLDPKNNTDVYTMDYSGFGVLAIKSIQEM